MWLWLAELDRTEEERTGLLRALCVCAAWRTLYEGGVTYSSLSMAFFSPFSSRSWSRELWCQPSGVNIISLAFSSTRRLNRDSAAGTLKHQ